jgi:hypothetical protein
MSNEIDLVVGSVAFKQITDLLVELGKVDGEIKKIGESAIKMNTALGVKNTADLTKLSAENAKLNKEIEKLIGSAAILETKLANATTAQAKSTKATTDALIAEEKLIAAKQKNADTTEKNANKEVKASQTRSKYITQETIDIRLKNKELAQEYTELSKNAGAYDKHDAQYRIMAKSLKDLAFQGKEGTKDFIEKEKALTVLGNRLKSVDAITGSHTRNVGNYASSWNGLGNSINQLTREAPAFANSLQTGFMALSNNIPILTDELGVLIDKNKKLQAGGKPTESILKTVAGAFFSWQTAISLGVTILTVYGAKLIDAMFNTNGLKIATDSLTNSLKLQQTELDKNIKILEYNAEIEIELAKKRGASEKEILEIKKKLGVDTVSETEKQYNILNARLDSFDKYRSLKAQGGNKAFLFLLNKYNGDVEKARTEFQRREITYTDANRKLLVDSKTKLYEQLKEKNDKNVLDELRGQNELNKKTNKAEDKSAEERAKAEKERKENEFKGDIADLENKKDIAKDRLDLFKGEVKDKIALSMNLANKEIDLAEKVYEYNLFLAGEDKGLQKKALAERSKAVRDSFKENVERAGDFYSDFFKKADESLPKTLFGDKYKMTDEQKADLKAHEDYIKKTLDEIKNYLGSFSSELGSNLGFKETFDFFIKIDEKGKNMWQKLDEDGVSSKEKFATRFNAITESAQEAFNFISNLSQENIKDEYNRLDKQKEISLGFAGDSAAAKEKIEEDYNKKKNEIAKKEAKAKKEQAIMNIAIDTAQAIMGLWVKPGFPAAIPMAIAVGALGALQIGMVASQKIPQYAKGTDNHRGGMMLVNDGAGDNFQEKVILPSGKVIRPQGRNVLMDAPKGTKVLNHEQQLFEMLQSNNISMSNPQYQGMTPDEMDEILGKHFGNIKTQNTIFDKNGFQSYVRNGNSITRSNSNRSQAIGISV